MYPAIADANSAVVPSHLSFAGWAPGNGQPVMFDFGSPPVGNLWMIRSVTIYGGNPFTVVEAFTCSLFTGDVYNFSVATLHITQMVIPSTVYVPDSAIVCHPGDNVIISTSKSVDNGQNIGANISVEEWRQDELIRECGNW